MIGVLNLMKNIAERIKHIESGKVMIHINNKQVLIEYNKQIKKRVK